MGIQAQKVGKDELPQQQPLVIGRAAHVADRRDFSLRNGRGGAYVRCGERPAAQIVRSRGEIERDGRDAASSQMDRNRLAPYHRYPTLLGVASKGPFGYLTAPVSLLPCS